jgi:hypothetical protein
VLQVARVFTAGAIVIDVGTIEGRGRAVVEANEAWGPWIYGCDPEGALEIVARTTAALVPPSHSGPV